MSLKGERYTEFKKDETAEMKKTYVHLKPGKQYRFHWSTGYKPYYIAAVQCHQGEGSRDGVGQGGKVCFCNQHQSYLCYAIRPQLEGEYRLARALSDVMLLVGSVELLAYNLMRILITLHCCSLVLLCSYCFSVSNCILVCELLIRYQRRHRLLIEALYSQNRKVVKKKYSELYRISCERFLKPYSNRVELALQRAILCDITRFNHDTLDSVISHKDFIILQYLWYMIFTNWKTGRLFSYVGELVHNDSNKTIIYSGRKDLCSFLYLYCRVALFSDELKTVDDCKWTTVNRYMCSSLNTARVVRIPQTIYSLLDVNAEFAVPALKRWICIIRKAIAKTKQICVCLWIM